MFQILPDLFEKYTNEPATVIVWQFPMSWVAFDRLADWMTITCWREWPTVGSAAPAASIGLVLTETIACGWIIEGSVGLRIASLADCWIAAVFKAIDDDGGWIIIGADGNGFCMRWPPVNSFRSLPPFWEGVAIISTLGTWTLRYRKLVCICYKLLSCVQPVELMFVSALKPRYYKLFQCLP